MRRRKDQGVVLANLVAAFRNGLAPDECEEFHECLIHIFRDPYGKKMGRSVERPKPPLVEYTYAYGRFWLSYYVHKVMQDTQKRNPVDAGIRIEVFAADYLAEYLADDL